MDMFVVNPLTQQDITELRRILGDEIERAKSSVRNLEEQIRLEALIQKSLQRMRQDLMEQKQESFAIHCERAMPRTPWTAN